MGWTVLIWLRRLLALSLMAASFYVTLQALDMLRDGFARPWAVLTAQEQAGMASMMGASSSRPLVSIAMPTRQPTATATLRPSPTATPTPRATPALSALRVDPLGPTPTPTDGARPNEPFKLSGTIEAIDGPTWTISGQKVFMPFPIRGTPRVGASAEVEGITRPDGVREAKVLSFSP